MKISKKNKLRYLRKKFRTYTKKKYPTSPPMPMTGIDALTKIFTHTKYTLDKRYYVNIPKIGSFEEVKEKPGWFSSDNIALFLHLFKYYLEEHARIVIDDNAILHRRIKKNPTEYDSVLYVDFVQSHFYVIQIKKDVIYVYNSLYVQKTPIEIKKNIELRIQNIFGSLSFFKSSVETIPLHVIQNYKQMDDNNCGIYAILTIFQIVFKKENIPLLPINNIRENMNLFFRDYIAYRNHVSSLHI